MEVVIMGGQDLPNGTYYLLGLVLCVIVHAHMTPEILCVRPILLARTRS